MHLKRLPLREVRLQALCVGLETGYWSSLGNVSIFLFSCCFQGLGLVFWNEVPGEEMSSLSLILGPLVLSLFLSCAASPSLPCNFYTTHVLAGPGAHTEGQRHPLTPVSAGLGAHAEGQHPISFLH